MPKGKKTKDMYELDFTGVGAGRSRGVRVPPGDYVIKVKDVKVTETKDGNPQFMWTLIGLTGALKGKELRDFTLMQGPGAFKLRTMMLAAQFDAPQAKRVKFYPKKMLGKVLGVTIDDHEWQGKTTSRVVDYFPVILKKDGRFKRLPLPGEDEFEREDDEDLDELTSDDEEEEELDEEDLEEEETEDGLEEEETEDEEESFEEAEEDEEEEEEGEDEEEDEEEEEEPPSKKNKTNNKKKGKK